MSVLTFVVVVMSVLMWLSHLCQIWSECCHDLVRLTWRMLTSYVPPSQVRFVQGRRRYLEGEHGRQGGEQPTSTSHGRPQRARPAGRLHRQVTSLQGRVCGVWFCSSYLTRAGSDNPVQYNFGRKEVFS